MRSFVCNRIIRKCRLLNDMRKSPVRTTIYNVNLKDKPASLRFHKYLLPLAAN